jgi:hypothetical protein
MFFGTSIVQLAQILNIYLTIFKLLHVPFSIIEKIPVTITAIIREEKEPLDSNNIIIFPHNNSRKTDSASIF